MCIHPCTICTVHVMIKQFSEELKSPKFKFNIPYEDVFVAAAKNYSTCLNLPLTTVIIYTSMVMDKTLTPVHGLNPDGLGLGLGFG